VSAPPAPRDPAPLGIHHVALRVADCERARDFYVGALGLREIGRSSSRGQGSGPAGTLESVWLGLDEGAILMLERRLRGAGPEEGSGHVLALAVEDLTAWEQRLAARGIAIEDRTAYTVYFRDPDGHRLGLTVFPRTA
jgi:catechol 2,3-dioxygenase-like lactoylglutathione lyase family enzyme